MAKTASKKVRKNPVAAKRSIKNKNTVKWEFPLSGKNIKIALIGILVIIVGYALMATGLSDGPAAIDGTWNNPWAVSVAPVVLVIGYCVIIPFAILKYYKKED